jgi:hypothetical protein
MFLLILQVLFQSMKQLTEAYVIYGYLIWALLCLSEPGVFSYSPTRLSETLQHLYVPLAVTVSNSVIFMGFIYFCCEQGLFF